jgi:hypothetical protein
MRIAIGNPSSTADTDKFYRSIGNRLERGFERSKPRDRGYYSDEVQAGRSVTPRRRLVQFSFLLQLNKSLFTKLVNLRVARHRTLTESSISQPIAFGIYIAQSKQ